MMSRKHFEAIAANIRQCSPSREEIEAMTSEYDISRFRTARETMCVHATGLCHIFKRENPAFNAQQFLTACGFDPHTMGLPAP